MKTSLCLDPSCFVSLEHLKNTISVLEEVWDRSFPLHVPSEVYDILILPPEKKFQELPKTINRWVDRRTKQNISRLGDAEKGEYVRISRHLLSEFNPHSTAIHSKRLQDFPIDDIAVNRNSTTERIVFDMMALSVSFGIRIIAFGKKTMNQVKRMKISVLELPSKVKKKVKSKRKIKKNLKILEFIDDVARLLPLFLDDWGIKMTVYIVTGPGKKIILFVADG